MPNTPSVPPPPPPPPPPWQGPAPEHAGAQRPWYRKKRVMIPLGIVVLAAIGSGLQEPGDTGDADTAVAATTPSEEATTSSPTPEATTPEVVSEETVTAEEDEEPGAPEPTVEATPEPTSVAPEPEPTSEPPAMSREQENALRHAADYLDYSAFSRSGLIDQLEFEGYSTENATFAVDALDVDWNEQAARHAEDYLDYSAFSRSGLIEQLEFEGYTREQAEYGATQAGL